MDILFSKIEGIGNEKKLIILHGFLGMSDNWKTMAVKYASLGYEVHSLDLRNHGKSFQTDLFNYRLLVDDVLAYASQHSITKTSVLGHSMGGKVAMLLACTQPDLIDKLIIADIGPKYYPLHHQSILEGLSAVDFSEISSRNEAEEILKLHIKEEGTRQFLLKSLYWIEPNKKLAFRFNLKALIENIEEIGKPLPENSLFTGQVLFIKGALSSYILDQDTEAIKIHFPNAIFKTVSKSGHWLHVENPTEFHDYTSIFLTK